VQRKKKASRLENVGSLITYKHRGKDTCLGYLFHAPEHGVYDASHGKVDITPEQADIHNMLLDQALMNGLDTHCEVGQGGTFYVDSDGRVITWLGTEIGPAPLGHYGTFIRNGKTFRATYSRGDDDDTVWVQRVS
jgi:hypothetical protein